MVPPVRTAASKLEMVLDAPEIVLFVSVSVVALPTKVSVEVGKVNVPVLTIVAITGLVKVLLVSVSVVARPTKVSVEVGSVRVPVFTMVAMTGAVKVLLVSVAVAAFLVASEVLSTLPSPTSPLTIPVGVLITGLVSVLLVKV